MLFSDPKNRKIITWK